MEHFSGMRILLIVLVLFFPTRFLNSESSQGQCWWCIITSYKSTSNTWTIPLKMALWWVRESRGWGVLLCELHLFWMQTEIQTTEREKGNGSQIWNRSTLGWQRHSSAHAIWSLKAAFSLIILSSSSSALAEFPWGENMPLSFSFFTILSFTKKVKGCGGEGAEVLSRPGLLSSSRPLNSQGLVMGCFK